MLGYIKCTIVFVVQYNVVPTQANNNISVTSVNVTNLSMNSVRSNKNKLNYDLIFVKADITFMFSSTSILLLVFKF